MMIDCWWKALYKHQLQSNCVGIQSWKPGGWRPDACHRIKHDCKVNTGQGTHWKSLKGAGSRQSPCTQDIHRRQCKARGRVVLGCSEQSAACGTANNQNLHSIDNMAECKAQWEVKQRLEGAEMETEVRISYTHTSRTVEVDLTVWNLDEEWLLAPPEGGWSLKGGKFCQPLSTSHHGSIVWQHGNASKNNGRKGEIARLGELPTERWQPELETIPSRLSRDVHTQPTSRMGNVSEVGEETKRPSQVVLRSDLATLQLP